MTTTWRVYSKINLLYSECFYICLRLCVNDDEVVIQPVCVCVCVCRSGKGRYPRSRSSCLTAGPSTTLKLRASDPSSTTRISRNRNGKSPKHKKDSEINLIGGKIPRRWQPLTILSCQVREFRQRIWFQPNLSSERPCYQSSIPRAPSSPILSNSARVFWSTSLTNPGFFWKHLQGHPGQPLQPHGNSPQFLQ